MRRSPAQASPARANAWAARTFAAGLGMALLGLAGEAFSEAAALTWPASTESPRALSAIAPKDAPLYALCGRADIALADVAQKNIQNLARGEPLFGPDELAFTLRAAGDPHVWGWGFSVSSAAISEADIAAREKRWLSGWNGLGERRCGIARGVRKDGARAVVFVAVDALADMEPLPVQARVGQWLTLRGQMLVPTREAKVILLGPRGAPKTVLASLSPDLRIQSTFSVDQPGAWTVQVLATVSTGPRPVLEAMVFAGTAPPTRFVQTPAPGEQAAQGAKDSADAVFRMLNAARAEEGFQALTRDEQLDALAKAHTENMIQAKMIGHDVGQGDLRARISAAGLKVRLAGENLASAKTTEQAHRVLWASPSHRDNMLYRDFKRAGVAALAGPDGHIWVAQVFSG